jgi:hypothetical protein
VTASITAADVATGGFAEVKVKNPGPSCSFSTVRRVFTMPLNVHPHLEKKRRNVGSTSIMCVRNNRIRQYASTHSFECYLDLDLHSVF